MKSYLTCPTCKRYITPEQVEAPCQRCDADMCSHCMRICQKCGKEVCINCFTSDHFCIQCKSLSLVNEGVTDVRKWKSDSKGVVGVAKTVYGVTEYFGEKERIKDRKLRRELGNEKYWKVKDEGATFALIMMIVIFIGFFFGMSAKSIGLMLALWLVLGIIGFFIWLSIT